MANFWDLPKRVREKIYRMNLVYDGTLTDTKHKRMVKWKPNYGRQRHFMPPLLLAAKKIDKEAAPIYYGENHFEFTHGHSAFQFVPSTYPRHVRLIRKLTCVWQTGHDREAWLLIGRMKDLQELYIRINEKLVIQQQLGSRSYTQFRVDPETFTPQEQLAVWKHPGMTGFLALPNIPHIEFIQTFNGRNELIGGPIPGGALETLVLPKLRANHRQMIVKEAGDDSFRFLDLPAEIRNRIYDLVLTVSGPVHPSTKKPTSAPKAIQNRSYTPPTPESALSLLAVNKQINYEALGIFYDRNSFVFHYPTQLHAFLLSLSSERQKYIRDITLYYYNTKSGGIDLVDLNFPMLKQLPGLKKLHIIMYDELRRKMTTRYWWHLRQYFLDQANPGLIPGMKTLFELRGVTEIKVRDLKLEEVFEEVKADRRFPEFVEGSRNACVVKLNDAFEHFNAALAAAQEGKINQEILKDNQWQTWDVFPAI